MTSIKKVNIFSIKATPKFIYGFLKMWIKIPKTIILFLASFIVVFVFYHFLFLGRIYPGIYIAGLNVSGKTKEEALSYLQTHVLVPEKIDLEYKNQLYSLPLTKVELSYDFPSTVDEAYFTHRSNFIFDSLVSPIKAVFKKKNIQLITNINEGKLKKNLFSVSNSISQEPVYPSIYLTKDKLVVEKGAPGFEINEEKIIKDIKFALSNLKEDKIAISVKIIDPSLSNTEELNLYNRGNKLLKKNLVLSFEFQEFIYTKNDLLKLLEPKSGYNKTEINALIEDICKKVERKPQNPSFIFLATQAGEEGKVKEFTPAKDGVKVKQEELSEKVIKALEEIETEDKTSVSISIPTINTPPEYKTEDVNNLGIRELLGRGVSRFTGSIASRIHNISLASGKFNGILVKPGEVFSFNDTLGDVSAYTGYKQAYIIQEGKTILGDGGGVCQVSTTFFRAVLNSGLPIIERRAHAYRVAYYEQGSPVGLDATVFYPTTDFKFKNDTPAHLLIQTSVDTKNKILIFEIYGTSDGRVATISKPKVTDVVPPPDDLYIDDPTLPIGTVKQIDWKAWGAKVSFKYAVVRGDETIIDKTFYSNYQPWQAKYLRGTGLVQ